MQSEKLFRNENWLRKKYIDEGLSLEKIAEICNCTDDGIYYWMKKFNIPRRNFTCAFSRCGSEHPAWGREGYWKGKEGLKPKTSTSFKKGHDTWNKGTKGIMKPNVTSFKKGQEPWNKGKVGVYSKEQLKALKESHMGNIPSLETRKKMGESRMRERNPNWNGGTSFIPYGQEFNDKLKEEIRKRDDYQCQFCGIKQNGKNFPIHHVDYNKKDSNPINLITLCDPDHMASNYNREKWQFFFEVYQELRMNH